MSYNPHPRTWSKIDRVLELHAKGYSLRRIALYSGLGRETVRRIIQTAKAQ